MLNEIFRTENLIKVIDRHCKKSRPGPDGMVWSDLGRNENTVIAAVQVRVENFVPGPYLEITCSRRKIFIPNVIDRIIQLAICDFLEDRVTWIPSSPIRKRVTGENSFYHYMSLFVRQHGPYVCHVDIKEFYPSINHSTFIDFIQSFVDDSGLRDLIKRILCLCVGARGLLIGNPLTTCLADKFLLNIDKHLIDMAMVCFHDDFFMFSQKLDRCEAFPVLMDRLLNNIDLRSNPEKTWIRKNPTIKNIL